MDFGVKWLGDRAELERSDGWIPNRWTHRCRMDEKTVGFRHDCIAGWDILINLFCWIRQRRDARAHPGPALALALSRARPRHLPRAKTRSHRVAAAMNARHRQTKSKWVGRPAGWWAGGRKGREVGSEAEWWIVYLPQNAAQARGDSPNYSQRRRKKKGSRDKKRGQRNDGPTNSESWTRASSGYVLFP